MKVPQKRRNEMRTCPAEGHEGLEALRSRGDPRVPGGPLGPAQLTAEAPGNLGEAGAGALLQPTQVGIGLSPMRNQQVGQDPRGSDGRRQQRPSKGPGYNRDQSGTAGRPQLAGGRIGQQRHVRLPRPQALKPWLWPLLEDAQAKGEQVHVHPLGLMDQDHAAGPSGRMAPRERWDKVE